MRKPSRLEKGFEVEWAYDLGKQTEGDFNPDKVKFTYRDFAAKREAIAFAKKIRPQVVMGDVRVIAFHLEPYEYDYPPFTREYDGEPEYVEVK